MVRESIPALQVMSNDGARGSLVLDAKQPGAVQVQWDDAGRQPVFARIGAGVAFYRGYTGEFPHGRRGWTAPLLRGYWFDQMSAEGHRLVFAQARPPVEADKEGGLAGRHGGKRQPRSGAGDGMVFARAGAAGWLEHHFESGSESGVEDEIRVVDADLLIGQWTLPLGVAAPASSFGLFHTSGDRGGRHATGFLLPVDARWGGRRGRCVTVVISGQYGRARND